MMRLSQVARKLNIGKNTIIEFLDSQGFKIEDNPNFKMWGYPAGTWGPEHADSLVDGKDFTWRYPCKNLTDDGIYCEL